MLMDRRLWKVRRLSEKENVDISENLQTRLKTKDHLNSELFGEEGLRWVVYKEEERDKDSEKKGEECNQVSSSILIGIFVSGSLVNLSHKSLSEDQIKLLSRGFPPLPGTLTEMS